jgi:hypothetical protein
VTEPARSRFETAARIGWLLLVAGVALRIAFFRDPSAQNVYLKEFVPAARAFWAGGDLYPPPAEASLEGKGFRYPPLCAALLWPFAACGPVLGSVLWRVLNAAVLLLGLRAVARAALPSAPTSGERALLLALACVCGITGINNGQANALLLGCVLLATASALRGRALWPAALVTVATVCKVYPLVFGMVLATLRPRIWPWLLLGTALGALLPFALADHGYVMAQYHKLYELLAHEDRTHDLANSYRDVRLVAATLGAPMPAPLFLLLQALGGLAVVLGAWRVRRRQGDAAAYAFAAAATLCWCLLLGPATEKATYQWLAPPLGWVLCAARRAHARGRLRLAGAALLLVLIDAVLPARRDLPWRMSMLPVAALLVAADLAWQALRAPEHAAGDATPVPAATSMPPR